MRRFSSIVIMSLLAAIPQVCLAAPAEVVGTYVGTIKGKTYTPGNATGVPLKGDFTLTIQANDTWNVVIPGDQFGAAIGAKFDTALGVININGSVDHFNMALHFNGDKVSGTLLYNRNQADPFDSLLEAKFKAKKSTP